jgi:hypothetical protein
MSKAKILILDDEIKWVAYHKHELEKAGFICEYAYDGREAVEKALSDRTIKIAIIDEILLEKDKYGNTVTQPLQGGDVRDDIRQQREDIYFIIISSKPEKEAEKWPNDPRRALREGTTIEKQIRQEKQVVNFFHKYDFDFEKENPEKVEQEYHVLIKTLREILTEQRTSPSQIIIPEFPSLYIGLGVNAEILKEEGNRKAGKIKHLRRLFASQYQQQDYQEIAIDQSVRNFYKSLKSPNQSTPLEKKLLWLEPNATLSKIKELKVKGKRNIVPAIKSTTRHFQILEWLAWQVECREEPTINADQFLYDICGLPRPASGGGRQNIERFQQELGQTGIQFETLNAKQRGNLKVEISRLSTTLVNANIGFTDNKQLFRCDEGTTTYTALFKIGMVLYSLTPSTNKT